MKVIRMMSMSILGLLWLVIEKVQGAPMNIGIRKAASSRISLNVLDVMNQSIDKARNEVAKAEESENRSQYHQVHNNDWTSAHY